MIPPRAGFILKKYLELCIVGLCAGGETKVNIARTTLVGA